MAGIQRSTNISSNTTLNGTEVIQSSYHIHIKVTKITLYLIIFLISSIGNCLVCLVIMKRRKMKTVTNYFILNLAFADLTLTLICIPFDIPVQEMDYIWPYGPFMCKILYPLQTMCLFASIFTLTTVSLTRYWAIIHPLSQQLSTCKAKGIVVLIWLLSIIPVSPYIYVLEYDGETQYCDEKWTSTASRKIYTAVLFVVQYVIPLSLITAVYARIGQELKTKTSQSENRYLQTVQAEDAKKVVRMLVAVTALFAICVLPTNIMWLWLDFGQADQVFKYFWEVVALCNIITFANSAANPICYTIFNENYRREIVYYIKKVLKCSPSGYSEQLEMAQQDGGRETVVTTVS